MRAQECGVKMNIALLTISSLSLVASLGTFAIMAKTANELKKAKTEVDDLKTKVTNNAAVVKTALGQLEF